MERLLLEVDSFELTSDSEITAPTWFIRAAGAGRVEIKKDNRRFHTHRRGPDNAGLRAAHCECRRLDREASERIHRAVQQGTL